MVEYMVFVVRVGLQGHTDILGVVGSLELAKGYIGSNVVSEAVITTSVPVQIGYELRAHSHIVIKVNMVIIKKFASADQPFHKTH